MVSNKGDDHDGDGGTRVIKCSGLDKKKEAKVYLNRSFFVYTQETIEGVSDLGLIVVL